MRSRWEHTDQDEVEFRDGLHGGLVWAVGIVIGAAMLMLTAGAAARTAADITGRAGTSVASPANPMDYTIDTLLRPATNAGAERTTTPAPAARPQGTAATATGGEAELRSEISRILTRSAARNEMSSQDRTYLTQLVAQRAGIPPQDAEKRVADAITSARDAADNARRGAVVTGFVTAASLMISLAAAWWAALKGGNHRDNKVAPRLNLPFNRRSFSS